jgi:hypothetical protein
MFPKAKDGYSLVSQPHCVMAISLSVAIDLGLPECPILAWYVSTSYAAVPEAPIDEDSQPLFGEEEIWCPNYLSNVKLPACNTSG